MKYEKNKYGISPGLFDLLVREAEKQSDDTLLPRADKSLSRSELYAINMAKAERAMNKKKYK